jgi:hypothetical protein
MISETIAGLGALKTAFDMTKALKNMDTAVAVNSAVIDLQETILTAQQAQAALIERVGQLEKQVADFEKWDAEKEKYDLKEIYPQNYAYAIKQDARGSAPTHLICATCYENRAKAILQKSSAVHLTCPVCKTVVQFRESRPTSGRAMTDYDIFNP